MRAVFSKTRGKSELPKIFFENLVLLSAAFEFISAFNGKFLDENVLDVDLLFDGHNLPSRRHVDQEYEASHAPE